MVSACATTTEQKFFGSYADPIQRPVEMTCTQVTSWIEWYGFEQEMAKALHLGETPHIFAMGEMAQAISINFEYCGGRDRFAARLKRMGGELKEVGTKKFLYRARGLAWYYELTFPNETPPRHLLVELAPLLPFVRIDPGLQPDHDK